MPILLETVNYFERGRREKLFRFESMWLSRDDCAEVVSRAWKDGINFERHVRFATCANELTKWASDNFGSIKKNIKKVEELKDSQSGRFDTQMLHNCEQLARELDELHRLEESYWFARSSANEMKDGDKDKSYFHRKATQRKRKNHIKGLFDKHHV